MLETPSLTLELRSDVRRGGVQNECNQRAIGAQNSDCLGQRRVDISDELERRDETDDLDGGLSDEDIEAWMETAVDPIESETREDDEEHNPE
jgi:hypothetical protein